MAFKMHTASYDEDVGEKYNPPWASSEISWRFSGTEPHFETTSRDEKLYRCVLTLPCSWEM